MPSWCSRSFAVCTLAVIFCAVAVPGWAESPIDPVELVRQAVQQELALTEATDFLCQVSLESGKHSQLQVVASTREGEIRRPLLHDGRPPDAESLSQWEESVEKVLVDPKARHDQLKHSQENAQRIRNIITAFPEAFLYEFDGRDAGTGYLRLKGKPNPRFAPSTREARVLQGMQATMLLDPDDHHMVRVDGVVTRDVDFGWGIFGKLYRGGRVAIENAKDTDGSWRRKLMYLNLRGRGLFRKFRIEVNERYSACQRLPENTTLAEAVERLRTYQVNDE